MGILYSLRLKCVNNRIPFRREKFTRGGVWEMEFRPCIDIHNGKVKQIVGGSLRDEGDSARENFVSREDASFFADFYRKDGLTGGHVILLNPVGSPYYEETKQQALLALGTDPGHWMVGGGISPENAGEFLGRGASHVIVTSYVFQNGRLQEDHLERMVKAVGREHLTLDLSCRARDGVYYIVTDRWQKFTSLPLTLVLLHDLGRYCDEFLIHAVDAEGKCRGVEEPLLKLLGEFEEIPVTYAGGVGNFRDLDIVKTLGRNHVNVTVGSALDLFGGAMPYRKVLEALSSVAGKQQR